MLYGLDTSALVRIIKAEPPELAEKVAKRVARLIAAGDTCLVSDVVVAETYYALQYHYGFTKAEAIADLRQIAETVGFEFSPSAKSALSLPRADKASPGIVDRILAGEYLSRDATTLSCERDFRKLPRTEVIQ